MTKRQAITPQMKIDALIYRYPIMCDWCDEQIHIGHEIEWDHVQALVHGGDHIFANLRPLHADPCHKEKTAYDIKANAKVKRLRGETCNQPKKKMPSRPFQKAPEGLKQWGRR